MHINVSVQLRIEERGREAMEFSECFNLSADPLSFLSFPSACNYSLFITMICGKSGNVEGLLIITGK